MPEVATTAAVDDLLAANAAVAVGVSGGKDGTAAALAVFRHLDRIGHSGPRLLIHSDLGMVEWKASLPACQDLARHLGAELAVTRRAAGGLMERWESRWDSSVRRYAELETVTLVLPWSTPAMRFCTSETKTAVILSELKRRYRGTPIVNATGVRREESTARSKMSIADLDPRNSRPGMPIMNWRPIIEWKVGEVFAEIENAGLQPHEAYTKWGASRVSCVACIMSSGKDLEAAARNPENHDVYRRMVALELRSTFAFQGARWLADVALPLLDDRALRALPLAKQAAVERQAYEKTIPRDMLYVKGWPTFIPSHTQAEHLASVRRAVAPLVGIDAKYLDANGVIARYTELFNMRPQNSIGGLQVDPREEEEGQTLSLF